jgi:hypothetical protein
MPFPFGNGVLLDPFFTKEGCSQVFPVHSRDCIDGDTLGARRRTFIVVGAGTETLFIHSFYHGKNSALPLGLPLGQDSKVSDFCSSEEHCGPVGARRNATATANALRVVKGKLGVAFGDWYRVGILGGAAAYGDIAASLLDAIERAPVDDEVLEDREGGRAQRLDLHGVTVLEATHVQLA